MNLSAVIDGTDEEGRSISAMQERGSGAEEAVKISKGGKK